MTQGPEQRAEQLVSTDQGSLITPETGRGSERFSWGKGAAFFVLLGVATIGGTYLAQTGAAEALRTLPLSDFQKETFASLVSSFGWAAGFLGSLEIGGRLGLIDRPNWSNLQGLFS